MTHVASHTNLPGYHTRLSTVEWESRSWKSKNIGPFVPLTGYDQTVDGVSYKSPLRSGIKPGTEWRFSTPYSRCVVKLESSSAPRSSILGVDVKRSESSIHPFLGLSLRPNTPLGFDAFGNVNVSENSIARAITECLNKVLDRKINLATSLAESVQTIKWLSGRIFDLVRGYRLLRKGHFRDLFRHLSKAAHVSRHPSRSFPGKMKRFRGTAQNWWLEYWYSFMPLVYDVDGLVRQLEDGLREKAQRFSVSRTVTVKSALQNPLLSDATRSYFDHALDGESTESVKVKLWGEVQSSRLASLNQLGFLNPLTVIWELVPFSFVVDWVIPIGNFLDSITATSGVTFVDGHMTKLVKSVWSAVVGENRHIPWEYWTVKPSGTCQVWAMQRSVFKGWPMGDVYLRNPLSTNHLITAIALITTLRK